MWWSRAVLLIALVALGPVGCGFRPLYGKPEASTAASSPAVAELAAIRIAGIDDRNGQLLRNVLVQRLTPLGEPAAPDYVLTVTLTARTEGLATTKDGHASLGRSFIEARYKLATEEGVGLSSGMARALSTYRDIGPRYGSTAIERDAIERALPEVAEDIRNQLAVYFADRRRQVP